jgi:disulfide bond formation protein DsbB
MVVDMNKAKILLYAAWAIALGATMGSIILSEIFGFVPCSLCWYQRILMFPLPILLTVGLYRRDPGVAAYALPLAGLGVLVAAYHALLQWGVIHENIAPCLATVACTTKQINWLGFVTIPFMSTLAFAGITGALLAYRYVRVRD